jgi:hypothetical protein
MKNGPRPPPLKIAVSKSEEIRGKKFKIDTIIDDDMPNYYEQVGDLYKSIISFRTSLQRDMFTAHQQALSRQPPCSSSPTGVCPVRVDRAPGQVLTRP